MDNSKSQEELNAEINDLLTPKCKFCNTKVKEDKSYHLIDFPCGTRVEIRQTYGGSAESWKQGEDCKAKENE